ncbi:hypothetical protein NGM10_17975 (plasmid) [Halorussus salilacus]|uniref:hypothetical protein n=1 Tax=Halorussus salilacus TaxID=2953750 RepID=UPI00209E00BA|nr:hypothetical protein [Halorussus salilacus]USZ70180.1 hypothetical protein NGM10_17975 [Halorussus salilacus]
MAQEESPSVTLAESTIEVDAGETSTVTAEYQFDVESAGTGDEALSSIGGTMWKLSDREVGDITATIDGESVDPTVSEESGHHDVSVPVEGVSDGDTVTVTLEYDVSGPTGELQTPLWVPEYSTPGQANVVDITATLPEGTTLSDDSFPTAETVDGNTVEFDLLHVPGFVKMGYGQTAAGGLTTDTLYSLVGVVLIVGFIVGGLAIDRKTA